MYMSVGHVAEMGGSEWFCPVHGISGAFDRSQYHFELVDQGFVQDFVIDTLERCPLPVLNILGISFLCQQFEDSQRYPLFRPLLEDAQEVQPEEGPKGLVEIDGYSVRAWHFPRG